MVLPTSVYCANCEAQVAKMVGDKLLIRTKGVMGVDKSGTVDIRCRVCRAVVILKGLRINTGDL